MKTVTLLTGINEHTLRAWETRYSAIVPARSNTGRRIYSEEHVERIRTLMNLCEHGHAIGNIASLENRELGQLHSLLSEPQAVPHTTDAATAKVSSLAKLIQNFELADLHANLSQALYQQGGVDFILHIVGPLMRELGRLIIEEKISVAHEHAVSAIVKAVLFELLFSIKSSAVTDPTKKKNTPKKMVFATMEGDNHELGILSAAALAKIQNHDAVYIGPNTPPEALAIAANSFNASSIVIGSVDIHPSMLRYPVTTYIEIVQAVLKKKCQIVMGSSSKAVAKQMGKFQDVKVISSLDEFVDELHQ